MEELQLQKFLGNKLLSSREHFSVVVQSGVL